MFATQLRRGIFGISTVLFYLSCAKGGSPAVTPPDGKDSAVVTNAIVPGEWTSATRSLTHWYDAVAFTDQANGFLVSYTVDSLFHSTDSGKTWQSIPLNAHDGWINLQFFDPQNGFIQGNHTILATTDGGTHWTAKSLPTPHALWFGFTTVLTGFYTDRDLGVYRTGDGGSSWSPVPGLSSPAGNYQSFTDPANGYNVRTDDRFFKTGDSGKTWTAVPNNLSDVSANGSDNTPYYSQLQFLDPGHGFFARRSGFYSTADAGVTWTRTPAPGPSMNSELKFFDLQTGYFKTDSALYLTTDAGASWSLKMKGEKDELFIGMCFTDSSHGWVCTSQGRVYRK